MFPSLIKTLKYLERKILPGLGVFLFAFSVTWMLAEALCREFFAKSFAISEELIVFTLMWAVFLNLAQSGREKYHISVDLFTRRMPSKIRDMVGILKAVLSLFYAVILIIASVQFISHLYRMGFISESPLQLPMWIVCLSVAIGAVLLSFYYFERLFQYFRKKHR
jgi:TRAP-type C4-dicarboxylate transport system permease small subunit